MMQKVQKAVSYIFHPIIIPSLVGILYFIYSPLYFELKYSYSVLFSVFLATYVIPIVLLGLFKNYKLIDSYHLVNPKERKLPFIFMILLTSYLGYKLSKMDLATNHLSYFFYSITVGATLLYLLILVKMKASVHMFGVSLATFFFIGISVYYKLNLSILISLFSAICGVVATSRLYLEAHTVKELIYGFLLGPISLAIIILAL